MARQMLLMGVTPTEQIYGVLDDETMNNGVVVGPGYVNHVPLWGYLTRVPDVVSITSPVHDRLWEKPVPLRLSAEDQKKVKSFLTDMLDVKFPDANVDDDFDLKVKSFRGPLEVKARFIRKFEPYDPDAADGDGDGIVQDGTPWERPAATRVLDRAGQEIRRGLNLQSRPDGARIVDADGNDVQYSPSWDDGTLGKPIRNVISSPKPEPKTPEPKKPDSETPGPEPKKPGSTPLADHGATTLKERGLRSVRDAANPNPEPAKPPKVEEVKPKSVHSPRDPDRPTVYYHATSERNVESIMRDGLKANDPAGGDPYLEDERGEAVYMGDIDTALEFGDFVIAVMVPPRDVQYDPNTSHEYVSGDIPPEQLRLVTNIGAERRHAQAIEDGWRVGDEYPDPPIDQGPQAQTVSARMSRRMGMRSLWYGEEEWVTEEYDDAVGAAGAAYSEWSGYEGNFRMRHASAALLGLPVPPADGSDVGAREVNEILATGDWQGQPEWAKAQAREAIELTTYLMNSAAYSKATERPMYRGLANVPGGSEILTSRTGDRFTMPLSAFSPNRELADQFATGPDGTSGQSVMLVLQPGARAHAAGDGYEDVFQDEAGDWVDDFTEYVTHGDFEVVSVRTRKGVTVVEIRQTATYSADGQSMSTKSAQTSKRRIPKWVWQMAGSMVKPPLPKPVRPRQYNKRP